VLFRFTIRRLRRLTELNRMGYAASRTLPGNSRCFRSAGEKLHCGDGATADCACAKPAATAQLLRPDVIEWQNHASADAKIATSRSDGRAARSIGAQTGVRGIQPPDRPRESFSRSVPKQLQTGVRPSRWVEATPPFRRMKGIQLPHR
jgi:hypothetical protein